MTFKPGETEQRVNVSVVDDPCKEKTEYFLAAITKVGNATLGRRVGTGAIYDNNDTLVCAVG